METGKPVIAPAGRLSTVEVLVTFRTAPDASDDERDAALHRAAERLYRALGNALHDLRTEVEVEDVGIGAARAEPSWPVTADGALYRDRVELARAAMAAGRQAGVPDLFHDATGRAFTLDAWASVRPPFDGELTARGADSTPGDARPRRWESDGC
jgi:hypothetical protein